MRILFAVLLCLPSFAFASNQCARIEASNSEVCLTWDGSGLDITYGGSLISAEHGVYAVGTVNGVAFEELLQVSEPSGNRLSAFANVWVRGVPPYDVELSFASDGKTENDSGKPYQFRLE